MEYPNLFYNIKEENAVIEIKQEEISFELIEEEEESCLIDEIKEEISLQNDIKEEDDRKENTGDEIYQIKMMEFINAEEQIDDNWTDPPGHEADPLALIPVIETRAMKMETRGYRMVKAALKSASIVKNDIVRNQVMKSVAEINHEPFEFIIWPSYESTACLTPNERQSAIEGWKMFLRQETESVTPIFQPLVPYSSDGESSSNSISFPGVVSNSNEPVQQKDENFNFESSVENLTPTSLVNCQNPSPSIDCYDSDIDPEYVPDSSGGSDTEFEAQTSSQHNIVEDFSCSFDLKVFSEERLNCNGIEVGASYEENMIENTNSPQRSLLTESQDLQNKPYSGINSENNTFLFQDNNKPKRVRRKDFCFYCETLVTTFARHLLRNHRFEIEVERINSKPIKSKERKHLIDLLRKKGNYLYGTTNTVKPVRTPILPNASSSVLPCTYCLGFYSRKQLWRHRKRCHQNPGNCNKEFSQAAGQNYLFKDVKFHSKLYEQVFPRMRADSISFTAKKDPMICSYGSRYLLTHRDKHQVNVTSRKMRELAKLLIEVKKIEPRISNLLHALKPEFFDVLVEAAKVAANYDPNADRYNAPTYAMNISTSLKECCEIGISYALKKKHCFGGQSATEAEAELRTTILLLKSNWKFEVSHQAANNLHVNKMNKITIVPLASDLKLLRDYLVKQASQAALTLNTNQCDLRAYRQLVETTYCRVLLLCRKRVGELQRLPLDLYEKNSNNHNYEEFEQVVKPIEMILIRKFKRVVIQGKRKVTPVLFSFDVQKHLDLLIKLRSNFVPLENTFLFANVNTTNPITGYKVLQKHSKLAGLKNPDAVTSRSLRKHLATISQLFQLNDQDIEQLASFMGHTSSVHRSEYRLPDDVFQTAKIAKLLLSMESGEGAKNKGKSLDEIDVNLEEDILLSTNIDEVDKGSKSSEEEDGDLLPLKYLIGKVEPHSTAEEHTSTSDVCRSTSKNMQIMKKHTKENPYKCTECDYSVSQYCRLKVHMRVHTGEKPYKCAECNYSASESSRLQVHMRVHTGEKPYKCAQCDYSAPESSRLQVHMRVHTGEKPYKCGLCDYSASKIGTLKMHTRVHTGEKPYKCAICDYSSSQSYHLKVHMRVHTGEKPYKCTQCDYSASLSGTLRTHMRVHTGEKPYKCTDCDYSSSLSGSLKSHMRMHTGENPIKCPLCDYSPSRSSRLKVHMMSHTGEKPYKCANCDYSASTIGRLKEHMRMHTGEKPYKCANCDYSASTLGRLKEHMRMHTGEKPYKCANCDYSASHLRQLKVHMRVHNGE